MRRVDCYGGEQSGEVVPVKPSNSDEWQTAGAWFTIGIVRSMKLRESMETSESKVAPIQLFVPTFRMNECLAEVAECLERGWTGLGFKTIEFEDAWKRYTALPNAHFVNSATSALHLAVELLRDRRGWEAGDEILTTPLTFVSTNHVILQAGLTPVFCDVDEYLCLDPASVLENITSRTRAVMFVGIGGNTGQFEDIVDICRSRGLALILDAAHMAGSRLHGRDAGQLADVACYSFQAVKNLPTADSGMVCFADDELDAAARKLSWLGISKDTYARAALGTYAWMYDVDHVGYKYHGNSIMAGLGLVGLKYLDEDNARRRQICESYEARLRGLGGIETVRTAPGCESSRHLFQVLADDRDGLMKALHSRNIFGGVHYRINTDYPMYAHASGTCPRAESASASLLSLPLHLRLTDGEVDRVVGAVEDFAGG